MPLYVALTFDRVYLRNGVIRQGFSMPGQLRPDGIMMRKMPQFGVLLHWPIKLEWLRITATATADTPAAAPSTFVNTPAGLDGVCGIHAVKRDQLAPVKWLEANAFLAASLPRENRVALTVEVDTDHPGFRSAVQERRDAGREEFVQTIQVRFFDAKQLNGTYVDEVGKIDLVFKPCRPLPRFQGVLAIDLGNASTTAASLNEADPVYRTDSIRLVPFDPPTGELAHDADPLPSVLRIDAIESPATVPSGTRRFPTLAEDDRSTAIAAVYGRMAVAGTGGDTAAGVIDGAKQLLTVKETTNAAPVGRSEPDQYFSMVIPHTRPGGPPQPEKIEVLNRLPGELLFAHTVKRFREAATQWPGDLVLTYPTTYSPRELRQLVRAASRGWLRAMSQPQSLEVAAESSDDAGLDLLAATVRAQLHIQQTSTADQALLGLTLDEASAAAFFHLYRRVFEQPGGLLRFRYLHPHGLRLLIIDCGGGTTDVALVQALASSTSLLEVDVLARTGLRAFGGDNITREVARVVKAQIALMVAKVAKPTTVPTGLQPLAPSGPAEADKALKQVEDFLAKVRAMDSEDVLVPTRFDARDVSPAGLQRRRAFQALWRLAEQIKRKLTDVKSVKLKDLDPAHLRKETSALIAAIVGPLQPGIQTQILTQLGELAIPRWQVDALARAPFSSIVGKCNRLIRKHLSGPPEREVDWVVISGNGSRYPLVREIAEAELHVAYLADRMTLDASNLKHAVAKGAVMARMVERIPRSVGVKFNRHLSELLPYDIGYHDMASNQTNTLYEEYTPYAKLADDPKLVKLVASGSGASGLGNSFVLERRFPGDEKYAAYAAFKFSAGIQGELRVQWDPLEGEFTVTDTVSGEVGVFTDLTDPRECTAAAQRGDV